MKKVRRYLSPLELEITKNKEKMNLEKKFKLMNNGNLKNTEFYDFDLKDFRQGGGRHN